MASLLITDLDNTLYDWVTFFARSFRAMVSELVVLLDVPEEQILDEFKSTHRALGSVEQPFAVFELPVVRERFGTADSAELKARLDPALHAFNRERVQSLQLYPGVEDTLRIAVAAGVTVVAHTEASAANAYYRVARLGLANRLQRIYGLEAPPIRHPDPARQEGLRPPAGLVVEMPVSERKPNPELLLDICAREGASRSTAVYIGDSLTRDVHMARLAGITSVWARYGTSYSPADWATVARVTNWSDEDVNRDAELRAEAAHDRPDHVAESFADVLNVLGIA